MRYAFVLISLLIGAPAFAADREPCATGMICASKPATLATAMQNAGYRAKLDKDSDGDPTISSAASGYDFDVYFYGCELKELCDSVQFQVSFTKDSTNTPELANEWNGDKRFSQAWIAKDGSFVVAYDLSTRGGVNQKNFEDVLSNWSRILGNLRAFFDKHPVPPTAPAAK